MKKILSISLCTIVATGTVFFGACDGGVPSKVLENIGVQQNSVALSVDGNITYATGKENTTQVYTFDGKMNAEKGNADFNMVITEGKDTQNFDAYLRNWNMFATNPETGVLGYGGNVLDITGNLIGSLETLPIQTINTVAEYDVSQEDQTLQKVEKYANIVFDMLGITLSGDDEQDLLAISNYFSAQAISFLNTAGAASYEDNRVTLNFNTLVYNLYTDATTLLSSFSAQTTIADILGNKIVKKYMNSLLSTTTAEKIHMGLPKIAAEIEKDLGDIPQEMLDLAKDVYEIQPKKGATAYEYVLQLISSKEFDAWMNEVYGQSLNLNQQLGEQATAIITNLLEQFPKVFTVTENSLTMQSNDSKTIVENVEIYLSLDDNFAIDGGGFSGAVSIDSPDTKLSLSADFNSKVYVEELTLKDISNENMQYIENVYADGANELNWVMFSDANENWYDYNIAAVMKDNQVVGFDVYYNCYNDGTGMYEDKKLNTVYDTTTNTLNFTHADFANTYDTLNFEVKLTDMNFIEYDENGEEVISYGMKAELYLDGEFMDSIKIKATSSTTITTTIGQFINTLN